MERVRVCRARFHRAPKSIVSPAEIYPPRITQAHEAVVTERMPCIVEGYRTPRLRTQDGKDLEVRIIAHTVTPVP